MAYNKINHLRKVVEIQDLYLEKQKTGLSNREIWRRYIYPRYYISERTMYNYFDIPAKHQLKKLEAKDIKQT